MSFFFNWLDLSALDLKSSINSILSSTTIPQLPQKVSISSLSLSHKAPKFEILDIIDLNEEKFKGLFKFNYDGGLNVVFNTDYEANAIKLIDFDSFTKPSFVLADKSTILPVAFKIKNIKIDAILTVVYNGRITVVFNDDPFIDLDIETSLDEFLDEDLFQMIKQDTLNMITDMLKQDLPEMLHSLNFEDDVKKPESDSTVAATIETKSFLEDEVNIQPSLKRSISSLSLFDQPTNIKLQENLFDTFSLKPHGFTDVIQRVSLSKVEYQNMKINPHGTTQGKKKRRVIKMNKKVNTNTTQKTKSLSSSLSIPASEAVAVSSSLSHTPLEESLEDIISSPILLQQQQSNLQSESSTTTLIDQSLGSISTNSMDDYLNSETLVMVTDDGKLDPYESLIHPMDLLPSYKTNPNNLKIVNNNIRPRGPSSNYINLNNDFKQFYMEKRDSNEDNEDDDDDCVFYDFE